MTAEIALANRKGGPEREARTPNGFDDLDSVAAYKVRQAVVRGHATLAGYSRSQVNRTGGIDKQGRTS